MNLLLAELPLMPLTFGCAKELFIVGSLFIAGRATSSLLFTLVVNESIKGQIRSI